MLKCNLKLKYGTTLIAVMFFLYVPMVTNGFGKTDLQPTEYVYTALVKPDRSSPKKGADDHGIMLTDSMILVQESGTRQLMGTYRLQNGEWSVSIQNQNKNYSLRQFGIISNDNGTIVTSDIYKYFKYKKGRRTRAGWLVAESQPIGWYSKGVYHPIDIANKK